MHLFFFNFELSDEHFSSLLNVSVLGTASYLPPPSAVEYEFRYVDRTGEVCACSRPFTFCTPKPLEELETLKEEGEEEDGEEGLLLVIPKAQLLQVGEIPKCCTKWSLIFK